MPSAYTIFVYFAFLQLFLYTHPEQDPHPPVFDLIILRTASTNQTTTAAIIITLPISIARNSLSLSQFFYIIIPTSIHIALTIKATIHAMTHWSTTIVTAHLPPSSLLTAAIAATHGV